MSTYLTTRQLLRDSCVTTSIFRDPFIQQCRAFNLMYSAKTKHHLSNQKALDYVPFKYFTKTACELELWSYKPHRKIGRMTLDEALEKHIKPGVILVRKNDPVEKEVPQVPRHPEQYVLMKINTKLHPSNLSKQNKGRAAAVGAKQAFLHTWADMGYIKHKLYQAYHMLRVGHCVEFHVCGKKRGHKEFQSDSRLFQDLAHLRPEVIKRAMPENSGILINPQTNYREFCWVIGPPAKKFKGEAGEIGAPDNMTKRFYKNRTIQTQLAKEKKQIADEERRRIEREEQDQIAREEGRWWTIERGTQHPPTRHLTFINPERRD